MDEKQTKPVIVFPENGHCKWPLGDPREFGFSFCGASPLYKPRAKIGGCYCETHYHLAMKTSETPIA